MEPDEVDHWTTETPANRSNKDAHWKRDNGLRRIMTLKTAVVNNFNWDVI